MTSRYTILITGASRGIGRALVEVYAAKPNTTVIAGVRKAESPASRSLLSLPHAQDSTVILIKLDVGKQEDHANAIAELQASHGVRQLDLVVANAALLSATAVFPTIAAVKIPDLERSLAVNVYGVIWLFQAARPLLEKAAAPKWMSVSSPAGSISGMEAVPIPNAVYGASKALLNWYTRKMHFENPWLTVVALHPG